MQKICIKKQQKKIKYVSLQLLPMSCSAFSHPVSTMRGDKCIIMQSNDYYEISLKGIDSEYKEYGFMQGSDWNHERLIWIAFHKNDYNKQCFLNTVGKDVIRYILSFLRFQAPTVRFH